MTEAECITHTHNAAISAAAEVCAEMAIRLISNGKARVNQVDRHTAEVLRLAESRILGLKEP